MKKDKKDIEDEIEIKEENEAIDEELIKEQENLESDELEELREENQKLKNDMLRAYADSENTKKRCQQEIEKNSKYAISSFAKDLLTVADNLDRAIEAVPEEKKKELDGFLKGIELTKDDLTKALIKNGIVKMDILNKVFDPNFHQVVQEVEDDTKPAGTVINELQTGYMINDRILREAMVIVTKGGK